MAMKELIFLQLSLVLSLVVVGETEFSFDEEIYAHVIKSTSKANSPLFHIKAPHCKYGSLEYRILGDYQPFGISAENGSIYLLHALETDSPTRFAFNVQVTDANQLCTASAQVQVYVVHVNEHKPIMSAAKYYCFVNENERTVEVRPKIRATDLDEGEAGEIRAIHIREKDIPFKVILGKDGSAIMVASEDLDAESIAEYRFSIYAVDNGTRARKSERSKVYCNVVDVNEYGPIFKHPSYEFEVYRGETYQNIIQVEAIDRDISRRNGKVCNYAIVENGIPFSVDSNGVVSLQQELPQNYPSDVTFHLRATDCASRDSDDDVVVRVKIRRQPAPTATTSVRNAPECKPGIIVQSSSRVQYLSCATNLQLLPSFKLNDCNYTDDHVLTVSAVLDSSLVRKGCERSHGAGTSVYSKCGVKDVTDLLPNPNSSWMEDSITEETVQGETNYIFDGNVASRLPKSMFKWDWDNSFTIAGWMLAKTSHNPQFILSLSDGKKLGDNYVGLYVINKIYDDQPRIGFIMNKDHGRCKFHEEWEAALGDMKWRHIAVVVENCNLQLQIDGIPVQPIGVKETLQPDQSHIQPKYVIGGRWLGTNQKYTDFYRGKLSQMIFTTDPIKNINCVLKCEENLELLTPLPTGFQIERAATRESIHITGRGSVASLHTILNGLVYFNKEPYPTPVKRKVHIRATIDKHVSTIDLDVDPPKNEIPRINLAGYCDNTIASYGLVNAAIRICPDVRIKVDGCLRMLDEAIVTINSDVADSSNLSVPIPILKRFDLTASYSANVLRIKGLARAKHYVTVLSNVIFSPTKHSMEKFVEIKMEVSAENDRFSSNDLVVRVDAESRRNLREHSSLYLVHARLDESAGALRLDKNQRSKRNSGSVLVGAVLSFTVALAAAGLVVFKISRKRTEAGDSVDRNHQSTDLLWDDEGLATAMNITMNPLLRFRPDSNSSEENLSDDQMRQSFEECSEASLYWSESEDETETEARNQLEWDSSFHRDFGEESAANKEENASCISYENEVDKGTRKLSGGDVIFVCPVDGSSSISESRL